MFKETMIDEAKIISIYSNKENTNVFYAGRLIAFDDKYVLIQSLNPAGKDDGLLCLNKENVYRIDYDGEYEKHLKEVSKFEKYDLSVNGNILLCLIQYSQEKKYMVEFEIYNNEDSYNTGYIKEINNDFVVIQVVNEEGLIDGESNILIDSISLLGSNCISCRKIEKLIKR